MTLALALTVYALIPGLGDDRYTARQHVSALIAALLPAGLEFVADAAEHDADCEVRARCKRLRAQHESLWLSSLAPGGQWPWIDSLALSFPERDSRISDYLSRAVGSGNRGDWTDSFPGFRLATRLLIEDLHAEGWSDARLRELLAEMRAGDEKQIASHRRYAAGVP